MAAHVQMTWANLKKMLVKDADIPVLSRGAEGVPWRFDVAATLDYLIAKAEREAAEIAARKHRLEELSGVTVPSPDGSASPSVASNAREIRNLAEAQMAIFKMAQQQRLYVPRDAVAKLLNDLMSMFRDEVLAAEARIDPTGQLPANVRVLLRDEVRTLLTAVRDRVDEFLADAG